MQSTGQYPIFSAYGKKTVFIVTNIDRFRPAQREPILKSAREAYGTSTDSIVPLDGKQALKASLERNDDLEKESGLHGLRQVIHELCVVRGLQTRAVGLYNSIRATEGDLRNAVLEFRMRIEEIILRLKKHKQSLEESRKETLEGFQGALRQAESRGKGDLDARIREIGFTDNGEDAGRKIGFTKACTDFQSSINENLRSAEARFTSLISDIQREPYSLPTFDPRGSKSGQSVVVRPSVTFKHLPIEVVQARIQLDWQVVDPLILNIEIFLGGLFSEEMKRNAEQKLDEMRRERHRAIHDQCDPKWNEVVERCRAHGQKEIIAAYASIKKSLDNVEKTLCGVEHEPLEQTKHRLDEMLSRRAIQPAVASRLVAAFRAAEMGMERFKRE